MLSGYKTYILATAGVLYAVFGFLSGHLDGQTAVGIVWTALVAAGLRSGISSSQ